MIKGRLTQPLIVGYGWAVIRIEGGKEEAFALQSLARLKLAAMPIDVPVLFLKWATLRFGDVKIETRGEQHVFEVQVWPTTLTRKPCELSCTPMESMAASDPAGDDARPTIERVKKTEKHATADKPEAVRVRPGRRKIARSQESDDVRTSSA